MFTMKAADCAAHVVVILILRNSSCDKAYDFEARRVIKNQSKLAMWLELSFVQQD